MNNEQFEMLMGLGNNLINSGLTFGILWVIIGAIVSIVTASIIGNR
jgi:hypothetical protein